MSARVLHVAPDVVEQCTRCDGASAQGRARILCECYARRATCDDTNDCSVKMSGVVAQPEEVVVVVVVVVRGRKQVAARGMLLRMRLWRREPVSTEGGIVDVAARRAARHNDCSGTHVDDACSDGQSLTFCLRINTRRCVGKAR